VGSVDGWMVMIGEGEEAVFGVNVGHPIVINGILSVRSATPSSWMTLGD